MGILSQYGISFYHALICLSMNIFHNSRASAWFFCAHFVSKKHRTVYARCFSFLFDILEFIGTYFSYGCKKRAEW